MLIKSDPYNAFVDYPAVAVASAGDGPLNGLTFAVKDIFDVAGYPTGCGNPQKRRESEADSPQEHAPAVAALLDAGADLGARSSKLYFGFRQPHRSGLTAAHGAAFQGWNEVIRFLHELGEPIDAVSDDGVTPRDLAEQREQAETVALIDELLGG